MTEGEERKDKNVELSRLTDIPHVSLDVSTESPEGLLSFPL